MAVNVFVHLSYWLDADKWQARFEQGLAPDKVPYGYHHAEKRGFIMSYSREHAEGDLLRQIREKLFRYLGFDLIHAWRNRQGILSADVICTHTEWEHLAVALLLLGIPRSRRPKLLAQSVWLFDQWLRLSLLRRWLYRFLLRQADVLTVPSPESLNVARNILPTTRSELILFGISLDSFPLQPVRALRAPHRPIRVLSLGNDRHRDWDTLLAALSGKEKFQLRIVSRNISQTSIKDKTNVEILETKSLHEIKEQYRWADFVVVPLSPNLHASGITVVLEAVAMGGPVVCSDTGGLRSYFSGNEICYVPAGHPSMLLETLLKLADDPDECVRMAKEAQIRFQDANLSSEGFADRHCTLTRILLPEH